MSFHGLASPVSLGEEVRAGISMRSMVTRCVFMHVAQHLMKVIPTTESVPTQKLNINTCLTFEITKGMKVKQPCHSKSNDTVHLNDPGNKVNGLNKHTLNSC